MIVLVVLRCAARLLQLPPGISTPAQQAPIMMVLLYTHRHWQRCWWSSGAAGPFQPLPGLPPPAEQTPNKVLLLGMYRHP